MRTTPATEPLGRELTGKLVELTRKWSGYGNGNFSSSVMGSRLRCCDGWSEGARWGWGQRGPKQLGYILNFRVSWSDSRRYITQIIFTELIILHDQVVIHIIKVQRQVLADS